MKTCTRCVLPDNYPGIEFDENGVCNYCNAHQKWTYRGREALDNFLKKFSGKGEKYDCVVGVSGGRDSSFALNYLAKQTNLKLVAFTGDSGFIPQAAMDNMKRMTDILGVELFTYNHDVLRKCVKNDLRAWLRRPTPAMIPMICSGCKLATSREVVRFAKRNRIPLVVMNIETPVEIGILKNQLLATNPLGRKIKKKGIAFVFGLIYELFMNPTYLLYPQNAYVFLLEYLYFFQFEWVRKLFYPHQTVMFDFYRYINWDEKVILSTITKELEWRKASGAPSTWRFDCELSYLKNYLLLESIGITEKHDGLSAMIREGIITRAEALDRLNAENETPPDALEISLGHMGLNESDKQLFYDRAKTLRIKDNAKS